MLTRCLHSSRACCPVLLDAGYPTFLLNLLRLPPLLQATDVVTCGGLQSAHALAVAAAAAEHGKRAHLLVRGERPAVPTGSHL